VTSSALLDTHALLWWATGDRRLGRNIRRMIEDADARIFVSAATAWEIATKVRLGRLEWPGSESIEAYSVGQDFELLPVTFAHGEQAGSWPQEHGDPFDRLLAAQSQLERLPLATNDSRIKRFEVHTIW
jgi:PIN domain nuclease of toxin-antitoxin system